MLPFKDLLCKAAAQVFCLRTGEPTVAALGHPYSTQYSTSRKSALGAPGTDPRGSASQHRRESNNLIKAKGIGAYAQVFFHPKDHQTGSVAEPYPRDAQMAGARVKMSISRALTTWSQMAAHRPGLPFLPHTSILPFPRLLCWAGFPWTSLMRAG